MITINFNNKIIVSIMKPWLENSYLTTVNVNGIITLFQICVQSITRTVCFSWILKHLKSRSPISFCSKSTSVLLLQLSVLGIPRMFILHFQLSYSLWSLGRTGEFSPCTPVSADSKASFCNLGGLWYCFYKLHSTAFAK